MKLKCTELITSKCGGIFNFFHMIFYILDIFKGLLFNFYPVKAVLLSLKYLQLFIFNIWLHFLASFFIREPKHSFSHIVLKMLWINNGIWRKINHILVHQLFITKICFSKLLSSFLHISACIYLLRNREILVHTFISY